MSILALDPLLRALKIRALFAISAIGLAIYPAYLEYEAKCLDVKAEAAVAAAAVAPAPVAVAAPKANYSPVLAPNAQLLAQVKKQVPPKPALDKKAEAYEDLILTVSREHKVSPALIRAVIQAESKFNHQAVSSQGAVGLMQVLPSTARSVGVKSPDTPLDNLRAGTRYLKLLLDQFDDNELLALAAYNCGPDAIRRYGNQLPPFRETQKFVTMVLEYYHSQIDS
ncbi:MAG: lytic transglycosylase domain-containing protein [Deltaproteobacteria bacterium]|jgi:soluble lytic murein transglycosylase-like protein|nr:lytic transglycosylase domain-containing protein [Deltaproteobacteria bacterium]